MGNQRAGASISHSEADEGRLGKYLHQTRRFKAPIRHRAAGFFCLSWRQRVFPLKIIVRCFALSGFISTPHLEVLSHFEPFWWLTYEAECEKCFEKNPLCQEAKREREKKRKKKSIPINYTITEYLLPHSLYSYSRVAPYQVAIMNVLPQCHWLDLKSKRLFLFFPSRDDWQPEASVLQTNILLQLESSLCEAVKCQNVRRYIWEI